MRHFVGGRFNAIFVTPPDADNERVGGGGGGEKGRVFRARQATCWAGFPRVGLIPSAAIFAGDIARLKVTTV